MSENRETRWPTSDAGTIEPRSPEQSADALVETVRAGLLDGSNALVPNTMTETAFDALSALDRLRSLLLRAEEALRFLLGCHDEHDPLCAIFLPQKECDCEKGIIEAALGVEPCYCHETSIRNCPRHGQGDA